MKKGRLILWSVVLLAVLGAGTYAGLELTGEDDPTANAPAQPQDAGQESASVDSSDKKGTSQPPVQSSPPNDSKTPTPVQPPQQKPPTLPQQTSDVIEIGATGSGSLPIDDKGYQNGAFRLERLDWQGGTLHVVGKMRAFEAVGYFRVRDENKQVVVAETVLHAREGAPSWSPIEGADCDLATLKGQTLSVDFYVKNMDDGSRTNTLTIKIRPQ